MDNLQMLGSAIVGMWVLNQLWPLVLYLYVCLLSCNLRLCAVVCLPAVNFDHMYKLRAPVGTVEGFDISAFDKAVRMSTVALVYQSILNIVRCSIHSSLLIYCNLLWCTEHAISHLCVAITRLGSAPPLRKEWSPSHTPSGNIPPMQGAMSVNWWTLTSHALYLRTPRWVLMGRWCWTTSIRPAMVWYCGWTTNSLMT